MRTLRRKRKTNRQVFGFLCDKDLVSRIKFVARLIGVTIYTVCEHLLQIGLTHVGFQVGTNAENMEPVIEELRGHLLRQHLVPERLDGEECGRRLIDKHLELSPEQEEVNAIIGLVNDFRDQGIPHDVVMEVIRSSVAQLQRQRKVQLIRRESDFKMLMEINRRFPRLIPGLLRVTAKYSPKEVLDALPRSKT